MRKKISIGFISLALVLLLAGLYPSMNCKGFATSRKR